MRNDLIMEKKKNQHYVPKFLLKLFSNSENLKTVHIYNRKRDVIIPNGSIKDQCKRDYIYGKDLSIENAFMKLEGTIASLFSRIFSNTNELKNLSPEEDINLREFILFQQVRTVGAKNETDIMVNDFVQRILQYDPYLSKHSHKFNITFSNPVIENLKIAVDTFKYILDLEIAILDADLQEFAISDNPAFTINPFLNLRNWSGSGLGIGSVGIIFILPIHPKYCICLYDPMIYKLSKKNYHKLTEADVNKINTLVLYYSSNNVYFKSDYMKEYLRNLNKQNLSTRERRPLNQEIKKVYQNGKLQKNVTAYLMGKEVVPFDSQLRSIPFSNYGINIPVNDNMDMTREYVKKIKKDDPNFQN